MPLHTPRSSLFPYTTLFRSESYQLTVNDGPNHLHGGDRGFHKVVWDAETFEGNGERGIVFTYTSEDGEEGYPGTLQTRVTYTLTDDDELILDYEATTDQAPRTTRPKHPNSNWQAINRATIP